MPVKTKNAQSDESSAGELNSICADMSEQMDRMYDTADNKAPSGSGASSRHAGVTSSETSSSGGASMMREKPEAPTAPALYSNRSADDIFTEIAGDA